MTHYRVLNLFEKKTIHKSQQNPVFPMLYGHRFVQNLVSPNTLIILGFFFHFFAIFY